MIDNKIRCRDCGELTGNKTERCGICRKIWRNNMEESVEIVGQSMDETRREDTHYVCDGRGSQIIGPGLIEPPTITSVTDFGVDIKTCPLCNKDFGLIPSCIIVSSSVDCPYCAESQPHIKHVNGFKLPEQQQSQEVIDHKYGGQMPISTDGKCSKCFESAITLINGVCNTCMSKVPNADTINWPKHYNTGKIQPIDFIESIGLDFRLANAVKYIARHNHKGKAKEDLTKAIWYIQRFIDKELTKEGSND